MRFRRLAALIVSVVAASQAASIERKGDAFQVTGWNSPSVPPGKSWASLFAVYAGAGNMPPLLGSYSVEAGSLVFHPQFPPAPGVHYRAVFRPPGGGAPIEKVFEGPSRETARTTHVEHVYPSSDVLPANQLRLYIYFSAPMSRGEAAQRIALLDDNGKVVKDVFLPGEELWDPEFRRLTMTFDPGRIKRGLTSNQAMGAPLTEGKRYKLTIDAAWLDARGVSMATSFTKAFRGGPADRTPPDPKKWRVTAMPTAVTVDFGKPMNYPLLLRMLRAPVAGKIDIANHETEWRFTPNQPFKPGDYKLTVDTGLEDLAGNHIGEPFDIDVFDHVTEHITNKTVSVPFTVR